MDKRKNKIDSVVDDFLSLVPSDQEVAWQTIKRVRRALEKQAENAWKNYEGVVSVPNGSITNEVPEFVAAD